MIVEHTTLSSNTVDDGSVEHDIPRWISAPFLLALLFIWGSFAYKTWFGIQYSHHDILWRFIATAGIIFLLLSTIFLYYRWDKYSNIFEFVFAPQWISWQKIMPAYALGAFIIPLAVFVFFPPEIYPKTFIGALIIMAGAVARITYVDVRDLRYEIEPEDPKRSIYALWSVFVIASGIALAWNLQGDARQFLAGYWKPEPQAVDIEPSDARLIRKVKDATSLEEVKEPDTKPSVTQPDDDARRVLVIQRDLDLKLEIAAAKAEKARQAEIAEIKKKLLETRQLLDQPKNADLRSAVIGRLIGVASGAELPNETEIDQLIYEVIMYIEDQADVDLQFELMRHLLGRETAIDVEEKRMKGSR